ncbi:dihydroxy-acid dehydratase [Olsenella sp. TM06-36]|uniref:dihydroxy-acid dehydratase n=1 Tax=unclassified Olsenella TaxID=2638792 RepID=UPI000E444C86|nr:MULTISPECIES: dihydroxy-acid dehydratase [unclassified Olsenella]RGJ45636.1 dihydroxy-acid dehydratase [Olsenella sp. TM06-36]RHJ92674.1 dihydroxy-acid dehydratase [Olsenella sp. AM05-7]RHJ97581.1 dihydroxy-acid dehydratase [Olsenella sp. AM05-17]
MQRKIDQLEPFQRAISKAHLASAGIAIDSLEDPDKPLIAIANSWNEVCPGHEPLRQLAAEVKKGVLEAGGEPIEFNTIGMCDGVAQGHPGMRYCLPHRDLITDSCEAMIVGEGVFDGVVYMGSCDKIIPGMLNAAARINLPSAIVTAGPCYDEIKPSQSKVLRAAFLRGEASERDVIEGTLKYYTGPGICPFLGTANTMGCLSEALGMMLPYGALWPSSTSQRRFSARQTGARVVELVRKGICPSDIMTQGALDNAVKLLASIGGSLNAMVHLPALAHELGLEVTWDKVADITSHTPVVCNVVPNGDISCINLYKAGGVPAVLKTIEGDLDTSAMTVTGRTLGENLDWDVPVDRSVIRTQDDSDSVCNGIQVLYGNLAPEGALVKTSAVPAEQHVWTGKAQVFESEEEAFAAYNAHAIKPGTGVVVRYEGPKGGPGMKELHRVTEIMKGIPNSAVITDGRFSGASGGLSVGYLCPEAFEGGTIALVRDCDEIHVDLNKNLIELNVSDEELSARRASWEPVIHENGGHLLERYSKQVASAKTGAVLS